MLLDIIKNKYISKPLTTLSVTSLLFITSSCAILKYGPGLAAGELRILRNSRSIEDVIENESISEEVKKKLKLIQEAKQFGIENLGLKPTRSFEKVNLIDPVPVSVYASPKDQLKLREINWILFKANCNTFFDKREALKEKKSLEQKGYDVYITKVLAYSTLGWFEDPILLGMLDENEVELSNIILHELTHNTVHKLKHMDFTEGIATFVGTQGAIEFICYKYGENSPKYNYAKNIRSDAELFSDFARDLYKELDVLYESDIPREAKLTIREKIFFESKKKFEELKNQMKTDKYVNFSKSELNNAYVLSRMLYMEDLQLYHDVYKSLGTDMKKTLEQFKKATKQKNPDAYLVEWLEARR